LATLATCIELRKQLLNISLFLVGVKLFLSPYGKNTDNKGLRRILRPQGQEVTENGKNYILWSSNLYFLPNNIRVITSGIVVVTGE